MKKTKKLVCLIVCALLMVSLFVGCSSEPAPDKLARSFYTAFYTGDRQTFLSLCPPEAAGYLGRNSGYNGVKNCKVDLLPLGEASLEQIARIGREYMYEAGISLNISEGYLYDCSVSLTYSNGENRTESASFDVLVGKIGEKWYAFPANL